MTFVDIWKTTYLPRFVNIVCDRPLISFIRINNCNAKIYFHSHTSAFLYSPKRPNSDPTWTVLVCACAVMASPASAANTTPQRTADNAAKPVVAVRTTPDCWQLGRRRTTPAGAGLARVGVLGDRIRWRPTTMFASVELACPLGCTN